MFGPIPISVLVPSDICIALTFITAAALGLTRLSILVCWTGWSQGVVFPNPSGEAARVPPLVTVYWEYQDYPTYDGNGTNCVERLIDR